MINLLLTLSIMFCDLKGSVVKPGVYQILNNNIYEVINMSGGLLKEANLDNINLSKKVTDEMVIYIPSINDKPFICPPCFCPIKKECSTTITKTTTKITTQIPTTTISKLININTATKEELANLNGIGLVIADNIILYRQERTFTEINDLLNVKGIGEAIFAKIKAFITV